MPTHEEVAKKIQAIEEEMKRIGFYQTEPLRDEQWNFKEAFAMDTMAYQQWLQFVFIPRVKEIIESNGEFPKTSMVGVQAMREFNGDPSAGKLISMLGEFDRMFA